MRLELDIKKKTGELDIRLIKVEDLLLGKVRL